MNNPPRPPTRAPAARMSPPIRPRSTAVLSPLLQRCTSRPTRCPGRPFPGAPPGRVRPRSRNGATPSRVGAARCRASRPFHCHPHHRSAGCDSHVTSAGGGAPLMTTTDPSVAASTAGSSTPFVKSVVELDRVVIRLAGDSGDGMQLTGNRFTSETASFGNDLSTLPNFPAEIRAPTGTLPGVSSFQLHFADHDIMTPGDAPDVLVAMNPAALRANLDDLPGGGLLIVDSDEFTPRNLAKVGYAENPLEDGSLDGWQLVSVPLTSLTLDALAGSGLGKKEAERSKNMFTLGLLSWMYHRPTEGTIRFLERTFRRKPEIAAANISAFRAGYNYGETTEAFAVSYEVKPAPMAPGRYRNISGNQALAYGLLAAGQRSGLPLFLGAYPITPASDILHEL